MLPEEGGGDAAERERVVGLRAREDCRLRPGASPAPSGPPRSVPLPILPLCLSHPFDLQIQQH